MHSYRFPPDEKPDPTALFGGQETINLPFGKDAFLVFSAYQSHGVLPYPGGVLSQPRSFKRLLEIMNTLYAAAEEDEVLVASLTGGIETRFERDGIDFSTLRDEDSAPPRSFDDFIKRG